MRGFLGSRTSLIPHQLYIAHEVASREAPRVLLADEVGLGKTIEAGLILHHQLITGRAERVLIVVPDPLLHQWLVEMRRRFNLKFSLFDAERMVESDSQNPFQDEQLVLASIEFFMEDPKRASDAIAAGWDLSIVDEAHHLGWSPLGSSPEYAFIEALGLEVKGLLLLTATPEQLGKESHFARLRLLDPGRFHDYTQFLHEEAEYEGLADVIQHLLDDDSLDLGLLQRLETLIAQDLADDLLARLTDPMATAEARKALIQLLLDRHGTGRILFRNTRSTIKGFPGRQLKATALPAPLGPSIVDQTSENVQDLLYPETQPTPSSQGEEWWRDNLRVDWLIKTLKSIRPQKALVIAAHKETVMDLEDALRQSGLQSALFHEGLSIISRDRAAAWFADEEDGTQVLICSEIGSEGRNFQFAHHLVLFDLPLNPDLLEQRIGRLDRIGQRETIKIHTAFLEGTAQEVLFRWYDEGLNAFRQQNPAAQTVFTALGNDLMSRLKAPQEDQVEPLIEAAKNLSQQTLEILHQGRDRLLELNSCRESEAAYLVDAIETQDQDQELWPYLERIFDAYGINVEEHSALCHILRPGEHMRLQFPELPDEGVTVTFDRNTALAREDILFLSFEHPMVRGAMDIILNGEHGNAALSILSHPDLDPGTLLVECFHIMDCAAPKRLQLGRFFPPVMMRTLIDGEGNDLSHLPPESFDHHPRQFDREHARELLRSQRKPIERAIRLAEKSTRASLPGLIEASGKKMLDSMTLELKRLAALRKVNPNVRKEELDQLKANALEMHSSIQTARHRLDAIRVIVTS
jgi:ATP-dependent helicase HepA